MKYLYQLGIVCAISFVAEILYYVIPLPIPASIYGLVIMFVLLMTKRIKVEQVEEIADFFLLIMPILFISPSVSLMTSLDIMKGNVIALLFMAAASTVLVTAVTGLVAQAIIRIQKKKKEGMKDE